MRSPTAVPFFRGAIVALLAVIIAAGLVLSGPTAFRPDPRSAEAALLSEVKKLLASDAQAGASYVVREDTQGEGRLDS